MGNALWHAIIPLTNVNEGMLAKKEKKLKA